MYTFDYTVERVVREFNEVFSEICSTNNEPTFAIVPKKDFPSFKANAINEVMGKQVVSPENMTETINGMTAVAETITVHCQQNGFIKVVIPYITIFAETLFPLMVSESKEEFEYKLKALSIVMIHEIGHFISEARLNGITVDAFSRMEEEANVIQTEIINKMNGMHLPNRAKMLGYCSLPYERLANESVGLTADVLADAFEILFN